MELIYTKNQLSSISQFILQQNFSIKYWFFYGDLGVGKTTFIKAIIKNLNKDIVANSPSFSLINVYEIALNQEIAHIDLYRLNSANDLLSIDLEESTTSMKFVFIEWGNKFPQIIKMFQPNIHIYLSPQHSNQNQRKLKISPFYLENISANNV